MQAVPTYGRNLIQTLDKEFLADCVVFCAPEAWEIVRGRFPGRPREVAVPRSMEQSVIEEQIRAMPSAQTVLGFGGGSACDAAKMYAWMTGARLILVPSILSVDAPYTKAIGVRIDHRVRYVGEVVPAHLLIDFDLIQQAPPRLNRAGIGDILSIYTALWDWRLASEQTGETFDQATADRSRQLFDRMVRGAREIRDCSEQGLRLLSELFIGEVALCEEFGNSRPEEGSEHYFAYCLESITRKTYLHGELIAFAVILVSLYQEQPVDELIEFLREVGVEVRLERIGVSLPEVERALLALPEYLKQEKQLPFGIFHHRGASRDSVRALIDRLGGLYIIRRE